jgi:hypothetical protein
LDGIAGSVFFRGGTLLERVRCGFPLDFEVLAIDLEAEEDLALGGGAAAPPPFPDTLVWGDCVVCRAGGFVVCCVGGFVICCAGGFVVFDMFGCEFIVGFLSWDCFFVLFCKSPTCARCTLILSFRNVVFGCAGFLSTTAFLNDLRMQIQHKMQMKNTDNRVTKVIHHQLLLSEDGVFGGAFGSGGLWGGEEGVGCEGGGGDGTGVDGGGGENGVELDFTEPVPPAKFPLAVVF